MAVPISVYMITYNNADTVDTALRSVQPFAAEIVVVDSGSTDGTQEIVRKYTDRLLHRPFPGFREQYQYAADQCTHPWALFLDADEEIGAALQAELVATLEANLRLPDTAQVKGYQGHRRTFYIDRWILHGGWLPDYEVRLYDRRVGNWRGDLHAKLHVQGPLADFRHFIYHYTYQDISDQLQTIDRYSNTAAGDMDRNGKRFSYLKLLGSPLVRFVREYVLKLGFLDGFPGLVVAVNTMFYVFNKHAKLWERQRVKPDDVARGKATKPE